VDTFREPTASDDTRQYDGDHVGKSSSVLRAERFRPEVGGGDEASESGEVIAVALAS
jgi:hypothetical protein